MVRALPAELSQEQDDSFREFVFVRWVPLSVYAFLAYEVELGSRRAPVEMAAFSFVTSPSDETALRLSSEVSMASPGRMSRVPLSVDGMSREHVATVQAHRCCESIFWLRKGRRGARVALEHGWGIAEATSHCAEAVECAEPGSVAYTMASDVVEFLRGRSSMRGVG